MSSDDAIAAAAAGSDAAGSDDPARRAAPADRGDGLAGSIRAVRLGQGANCSSVGSVVDTLFMTAAVGGAILAAIAASMRREPVRVVGDGPGGAGAKPGDDPRGEGAGATPADGAEPRP